MAEIHARLVDALRRELLTQGLAAGDGATAFHVHGDLDLEALARAAENAIDEDQPEDGVPPSHLNATNDG